MTKVVVVGSVSPVEVEKKHTHTQQWIFKTRLQRFSRPKVSIWCKD